MHKVIQKKIKLPVGAKDGDLAEMFNQMLGTGSVNLTIAYPRYERVRGILDQLLKLIEMFNKSPFMEKYTEFAGEKVEIEAFTKDGREKLVELFSVDLSSHIWDLNAVEEEQKAAFSEIYEKAKKSDLVNTFVMTCDRLVAYKKYIGDVNKLNGKFITTMPGVEFCPFPFTKLNFKYIFNLVNDQETTKRFFLTVLNKAFELSYKLWNEITSPDIDVDEFSEVIMLNLKEVQKRPELNRCNKAFKKIEESIGMLKGRFNNYYRDFIQTKNSTIMMEHFILDVAKDTSPDPETTQQFRKIIAFYRKMAQNQIHNPKVKMLFDKVNESFKELERNTGNLVNIDKGADEPDSDDEELEELAKSFAEATTEEKIGEKPIDEVMKFING